MRKRKKKKAIEVKIQGRTAPRNWIKGRANKKIKQKLKQKNK